MKPNTFPSIVEANRRNFEMAWAAGDVPTIESALPPSTDPRFEATLEELVHLDLEFRWKKWKARSVDQQSTEPPASVEDYLRRFQALRKPEIIGRIARTELMIRRRAGEQPEVEDFVARLTKGPWVLDPTGETVSVGQLKSAQVGPQQLAEALRYALAAEDLAARDNDPSGDSTGFWDKDGTRFDERGQVRRTGVDALAEGMHQVAGYEILEPIAAGGMGVVFKARQVGLNRLVALKMIRSGACASEEELARFQREAAAVAQLQHPNIVPIYEIGRHGDQPYFSMEFVEGGTLAAQLNGTPWTADRAAKLTAQVALAIDVAHSKKILHRDLKPGNILLARAVPHDPSMNSPWSADPDILEMVPKVGDFGLAKRLDDGTDLQTQTDAILGTACYMSPEQAFGESRNLGRATDIYAVGAILYELLTGRPPFKAATVLGTLEQVRKQDAVSPRLLNSAIPRDLETICLKCLAKEPQRRYSTARELAEDLHRFMRQEPILARPVGMAERTWLWCRREPKVALLSASVVCVLLVGAIVASVLAFLERSQANVANQNAKKWQAAQGREKAARIEADGRRLEADRRRIEAEDEKNRSRRLTDFLTGVLAAPDWATDGRAVTIAETMSIARDQVTDAFSDDAKTRAQILRAIGETYSGLGLYSESIAALEEARTVALEGYGPDSLETLQAVNSLGVAYLLAEKPEQARPLLEESRATANRVLVDKPADTLLLAQSTAIAYFKIGEVSLAVQQMKQVLTTAEQELGPRHEITLQCMNNLARAYKEQGEVRKALELQEGLLPRLRIVYPEDHPHIITALGNLGSLYDIVGETARAQPLFEEAHRRAIARLGIDHPKTLECAHNLAYGYSRSEERRSEAAALYEQLVERSTNVLGRNHPQISVTLLNLADVYLALGRIEEGVKTCEIALERRRATLQADHPRILHAQCRLGSAYLKAGQHEQAEAILRDAADKLKVALSPEHPISLECQLELGKACQSTNKAAESLGILEDVVLRSRNAAGVRTQTFREASALLLTAYKSSNQWKQAARIQELIVAELREALGDAHRTTIAEIDHLTFCYLNAGDERAISTQSEALTLRRKHLGPDDRVTSVCLYNLASAYHHARQLESAEATFRECWELRLRLQPDHWETWDAQVQLGAVLRDQRRFEEAEEMLVQGCENFTKGIKQVPPAERRRAVYAFRNAMQLFSDWGKPEKSAALTDRLSSMMPRKDHPETQAPANSGSFFFLDAQSVANQTLAGPMPDLNIGQQEFSDVLFRIGEKGIQLAGANVRERPEQVTGIRVERKAAKVHFLHGVVFSSPTPDGVKVGWYELKYASGETASIPIIQGENVREHWFDSAVEVSITKGKIAWTGTNAAAKARGKKLCLCQFTFTNDRPETPIVEISYHSAMHQSGAAPFCVAITVEAPDGEPPVPATKQ